MKITDKVKIGGMVYDVVVEDFVGDNTMTEGEIDYSELTIKLKRSILQKEQYAKLVFLHEIVHGVFEHCGIEQNENVVNRISRGLFSVIEDNPDIFGMTE